MANQEFIKEWTAALRSGDYKQGTGRLHTLTADGEHLFCCLGVAQDLLAKKGIVQECEPREYGSVFEIGYSDASTDCEVDVLTDWAKEFIGLGAANPDVAVEDGRLSVAELNDDGSTFTEIADLIDKTFGVNDA